MNRFASSSSGLPALGILAVCLFGSCKSLPNAKPDSISSSVKPGPSQPEPTGNPNLISPYDWTLGSWKGFRKGSRNPKTEPMTLRIEPILGGAGQLRHLEVVHSGGVYRGFAVQVYDPKLELWVRQYVNSSRGSFARLESKGGDPHSVWQSATPGRTRESRLHSERIPPDGWRRTMTISEDRGETWRTIWTDELRAVPQE